VEFLREFPVRQIGEGQRFIGSGSYPIARTQLIGVLTLVTAIGHQFRHVPMTARSSLLQEGGQGAIKLDFVAHIVKQHISQHPQFFSQ
jgi:hypothetical protein